MDMNNAISARTNASASIDANAASDEFLIYCYKVVPCTRKYPHDWAQCPCGHTGERAARRHPNLGYAPIACSYAKQRRPCPRGDQCPRAHNLFEYWLHPQRYRTDLCQYGSNCDRPVCFFAHTLDELRPLDPALPAPESCWSANAASCKASSVQQSNSSSSTRTASPPQQQQQLCMPSDSEGLQQQQQQQAVAASVPTQLGPPLQLQPQQQLYVQVPGHNVIYIGAAGSSANSQAYMIQHQQQQQSPEEYILVHTTQGMAPMQQQQQLLMPVNMVAVQQTDMMPPPGGPIASSSVLPGYSVITASRSMLPQTQLLHLDTVQYRNAGFVNSMSAAMRGVALSDCSSRSTASIEDVVCGTLPLPPPAAIPRAAAAAGATSQGLALPIHASAAAVSTLAAGSNPNTSAAALLPTAGLYGDALWAHQPGMGLALSMQNSGLNQGLNIGQQYIL